MAHTQYSHTSQLAVISHMTQVHMALTLHNLKKNYVILATTSGRHCACYLYDGYTSKELVQLLGS